MTALLSKFFWINFSSKIFGDTVEKVLLMLQSSVTASAVFPSSTKGILSRQKSNWGTTIHAEISFTSLSVTFWSEDRGLWTLGAFMAGTPKGWFVTSTDKLLLRKVLGIAIWWAKWLTSYLVEERLKFHLTQYMYCILCSKYQESDFTPHTW